MAIKIRNGIIYIDILHNGLRYRQSTKLKDSKVNRKHVNEIYIPEFIKNLNNGVLDDTIEYYANIFLENKSIEVKESTLGKYRYIVKYILELFPKRKVTKITVSNVKTFKTHLLKKLSAKTVRDYMTVFKGVLDEAIHDEVLEKNPFNHVPLPKKEKSEIQPFSIKEVNILLEISEGFFRNVIAILVYTGMRTGEALALKWSDVDFKKRIIHIKRTRSALKLGTPKTEKSNRIIPIFDDLIPYLTDQYNSTNHHEFVILNSHDRPYTKSETLLNYYWYPLLENLGFEKRPFYQLRHTFATTMLNSGLYTPNMIAKILGHTNTAMLFTVYSAFLKSDLDNINLSYGLFSMAQNGTN